MIYIVRRLKLTVLVEDTVDTSRKYLKAKHGLSIKAEAKEGDKRFSFLVDTGPDSEVLLHNAKTLKASLKETEAIFLSHGHHDHSGGLVGVLDRIGERTPVIAHPRLFEPKLKLKPALTCIGSPFGRLEIERSGGAILLSRSPVTLMDGVSTTGEVERITPYEKVKGYWTISRERFMEDAMVDDQSLIFNLEGKGLAIVSGCAHAGIVNTVLHSKKVMGADRIHALIGGFHLAGADTERIRLTVEELIKIDPEIINPCHCTGGKAAKMLKKAFGDRYGKPKTGDVIDL